jgi:hypothetical protein
MILANYVTITSASDKMLCEAIGKLIDLDAMVDRLQATDCQHCAPFTIEQVKFAFKEWIEQHIESIEMQPEWFINREFKYCDRHLPELDSYYFPEQEDDLGLLAEELGAAEPNHFNDLRLVVGFKGKIPVIEAAPLLLLDLRRLVAASHIPGVCRSRRWKSSPHIESAGFNIELRSKFLFSRSLCKDDRACGIGDCPLLLLLLELPAVLSRCCSLFFSLSK